MLIHLCRWMLRLTLLLLALPVGGLALALLREPASRIPGVLLLMAALALPFSEGIFYCLQQWEKRCK